MQQDLTESVRRFGQAIVDDQRRNSEKLSRVLRSMAEPPPIGLDILKAIFKARPCVSVHITRQALELQSKLAAVGAQIQRQQEETNRKMIDLLRRRPLWTLERF